MSSFTSSEKEESRDNSNVVSSHPTAAVNSSSVEQSSTAAENTSGKEDPPTTIPSVVQIPSGKVSIQLRSVGSAPALKHNKFKLDGNRSLHEVERFLRKNLNHDKALFLYCGSGFSPTPDLLLQDLYDSFQIGSELTISYGFQETWG